LAEDIHNFKVLQGEKILPNYGCNCNRVMGECPLDGNCLENSVVYKAEINWGKFRHTNLYRPY
jgi:hypothetical protein